MTSLKLGINLSDHAWPNFTTICGTQFDIQVTVHRDMFL